MNPLEILGIIGTLFIIAAFCMNGEKKIRILDTVGAVFFIVYGIGIHSLSTVLLNCVLVFIQIIKLIRHKES